MNNKIFFALLISVNGMNLCATNKQHATPANNMQTHGEPMSTAQQEELRDIIRAIKSLKINKEISIDAQDIEIIEEFIEPGRVACNKANNINISRSEYTQMLFRTLAAFTEDHASMQEWRSFFETYDLPHMRPREIFEQNTDLRDEAERLRKRNIMCVGAGLIIGCGAGVATTRVADANLVEGFFNQGLKHSKLITAQLPLEPEKKLGAEIMINSIASLGNYYFKMKALKRGAEATEIQQALTENPLLATSFLQHCITTPLKDATRPKDYTMDFKDGVLLCGLSATSHLIDAIPLPTNIHLLGEDTTIGISTNQLIRAGKESIKDAAQCYVASQLFANQIKGTHNPSKIHTLTLEDLLFITTSNLGRELGYGLVSQLAHKKIAPALNSTNRAMLQALFPADGIPQDGWQESARVATIQTITWCAAAGLMLANFAGEKLMPHIVIPYFRGI